jgi:cytoskeletal protein CcmA (bactofilin family)
MALWNFKSKDKFEDVDSVIIPTTRADNVPVTVATPTIRHATSVVAAGAVVSGSMTAPGDIQVEGHVIGDVRCATVMIGKDGDVKGNVTAETATIRGRVLGNVRARTIQLAATGSVEGDLSHAVLIIEEGGVFEGRSKRSADPLNELALSAPSHDEVPSAASSLDTAAEAKATDVGTDKATPTAAVTKISSATPKAKKSKPAPEPKATEQSDSLDQPARSGVADALGDQFAVAS